MNDETVIQMDGGAANDNARDEIEPRDCAHCRVQPAVLAGLCGVCFCDAESELAARAYDWNGERF